MAVIIDFWDAQTIEQHWGSPLVSPVNRLYRTQARCLPQSDTFDPAAPNNWESDNGHKVVKVRSYRHDMDIDWREEGMM